MVAEVSGTVVHTVVDEEAQTVAEARPLSNFQMAISSAHANHPTEPPLF